MKYNKHKQPYEIIGRFQVFEGIYAVDYIRVRFSITRKEQVVPAYLEKKGDFQDLSLLEEKPKKAIVELSANDDFVTADSITATGINILEDRLQFAETQVTVTADQIDTKYNGTDFPEKKDEDTISIKPKSRFIATKPDGKENLVSVTVEDFCELHDLDVEAVKACLAGEQKTHRKWRFRAE